jgi:hypothetical protein
MLAIREFKWHVQVAKQQHEVYCCPEAVVRHPTSTEYPTECGGTVSNILHSGHSETLTAECYARHAEVPNNVQVTRMHV